ncbi:MAG: SRPBCC domain-containing protein [Candidatus Acidiferrales bacterium]
MVFDALTKPELVKQWLLGPPGWSMPVCEIDLRVGGAYRFLWRGPDAGWKPIAQLAPDVPPTRDLGRNLGAWLLGCAMVYATLFGIGKLCFGQLASGAAMLTFAALCAAVIYRLISGALGSLIADA